MNDEIKELLNSALPTPPPTAVDGDTAVADGRRRLGRRRYAAGGGVLAGVAAVAVAISLAMNTVGGSGGVPGVTAGASPSESSSEDIETEEPAEIVLPELDPDFDYYWARNIMGRENERTKVYTEALHAYLGEKFPGYNGSAGTPAAFIREVLDLTKQITPRNGGSDLGVTQSMVTVPVFSLQTVSDPLIGGNDYNFFQFPDTADVVDNLNIMVWPKGGYTRNGNNGPGDFQFRFPGGPDFFDLAGCDDYELDVQAGQHLAVEVDCESAAGGSGLKITRTTRNAASGFVSVEHSAIFYHRDGTAVVVTDRASDAESDETMPPSLSTGELLDLARSLPGPDED